MKITTSPDCGNSPKNVRAQQVGIALEAADAAALAELLAADVRWKIVGDTTGCGIEPLLDALAKRPRPKECRIEHAIVHGKVGAVSGTLVRRDADALAFCHMLVFSTAACRSVASITTFTGPAPRSDANIE